MRKYYFYNTNFVLYWVLPFLLGFFLIFFLALNFFAMVSFQIEDSNSFVAHLNKLLFSDLGVSAVFLLFCIMFALLLFSKVTARITFDSEKLIVQEAFKKSRVHEFSLKDFQGFKLYPEGWPKIVKLISAQGNEIFLVRLYSKNKALIFKNILENQYKFQEIPFDTKPKMLGKMSKDKYEDPLNYEMSLLGMSETALANKSGVLKFVAIILFVVVLGIGLSFVAVDLWGGF